MQRPHDAAERAALGPSPDHSLDRTAYRAPGLRSHHGAFHLVSPNVPESAWGRRRTLRKHRLPLALLAFLGLVLPGCSDDPASPSGEPDKAEYSASVLAYVDAESATHGVALTSSHDRVFVTAFTRGELLVLDPATFLITDRIAVGAGPVNVEISESRGHIYVSNELGGTVTVLRLSDYSVLETIESGSRPHGMDLDPTEATLLVCNLGSDTISIIDLNTLTLTGQIAVGSTPDSPVFTPDGRFVYSTNYNGREPSSLSKIDAATWTELARIPIGIHPHGLQVSPDGERLYVTLEGEDTVVVLDTEDDTIVGRYAVGGLPHGLGLSPDGHYLWSGDLGGRGITILDAATGEILQNLEMSASAQPHVIEFSSDGTRAYVSDFFAQRVVVVDVTLK